MTAIISTANADLAASSPHHPLSAAQAARLQLLPGMANLALFVPLAWSFHRLGLPPLLALAGSVLLAEVPLSWWLMIRALRRESGNGFSWARAFPWWASLPWWQYLLIGVPLIVFGMIMIGGVTPALAGAIRGVIALDLPVWLALDPDPSMFARLGQPTLVALWLASLVVFAGIGGVTQELFSRGFLLPRTAHLGATAPLLNALWFAVMHLAAPWSWPGFFLLSLPWAYLAWWKRSTRIALVGHVGMLAMQSLMMALIVFGVVSPDRMGGG